MRERQDSNSQLVLSGSIDLRVRVFGSMIVIAVGFTPAGAPGRIISQYIEPSHTGIKPASNIMMPCAACVRCDMYVYER
jgi:hypothetical protein